MKHHSETHIIKTTAMKQSLGLNGDLKPEHKKIANITTMSSTIDIDSQAKVYSFYVNRRIKKNTCYKRRYKMDIMQHFAVYFCLRRKCQVIV